MENIPLFHFMLFNMVTGEQIFLCWTLVAGSLWIITKLHTLVAGVACLELVPGYDNEKQNRPSGVSVDSLRCDCT